MGVVSVWSAWSLDDGWHLWATIIFFFLLRPFPVSRYCFVSSTPFPTLLSFSPLNHIAQRKKLKPDTKVGGDQMQLVPMISKVGRDASHEAVAPMTPSKLK